MVMCEQCGKQAATVQVTRVANDGETVSHFCFGCAAQQGLTIEMKGSSLQPQTAQQEIKQDLRECRHCHLKFSDFAVKGWLGCPACYGEFEKEIDAMLLQMHGANSHNGKAYAEHSEGSLGTADIRSLSKELAEAIIQEEFELAALIRDKIRQRSSLPYSDLA